MVLWAAVMEESHSSLLN